MLIDELKKQMFAAMKAKEIVKKEVLRTAIGEVTATGEEATDERVLKVLKKMMKSNNETLQAASDETQIAALKSELTVLQVFVPKGLSVSQIVAALGDVQAAIRDAGNAGQATGVAMKHLKAQAAEVSGKDVATAVQELRA